MGESQDLGGVAAFWAVVDYTKVTYGLSEDQAIRYAMGVVARKYSKDKERGKA